eukprot:TRINITY_DN37194_c0_g1_i1.p1 TRINITY_DN37194_c0_g1~~TRINITY_DN37194_c0_g1_i1.p1  ORF type:complete len:595 (+),score=267.64 TRINITY_DN37194_c0_g1_i1:51-1835(+)
MEKGGVPPPAEAKVRELVKQLQGSSELQRRLFEEVNQMRELLGRNTELAHGTAQGLSHSLGLVGPLQQDLANKSVLIMRLVQDLEDRDAAAGVLRADVEHARAEISTLRAENVDMQQRLGRMPAAAPQAALAAELSALSKPEVDARCIRMNAAAHAAAAEVREVKQKLVSANEELLRHRDRLHSVAVLRQGLHDQSQYILQLQEERKQYRARYRQYREAAESQEQVIGQLESLLRKRAEERPHQDAAAAAPTESALRLKLATLQRQRGDWEQERAQLLAKLETSAGQWDRDRAAEEERWSRERGRVEEEARERERHWEDTMRRCQQELDRLDPASAGRDSPQRTGSASERQLIQQLQRFTGQAAEDRRELSELQARLGGTEAEQAEQAGVLQRAEAGLKEKDASLAEARRKLEQCDEERRRLLEQAREARLKLAECEAEKAAAPGQAQEGDDERAVLKLRVRLEEKTTHVSTLEQTLVSRERTYAKEVASLKAQLAEARAAVMAAKPPSPAPTGPRPPAVRRETGSALPPLTPSSGRAASHAVVAAALTVAGCATAPPPAPAGRGYRRRTNQRQSDGQKLQPLRLVPRHRFQTD